MVDFAKARMLRQNTPVEDHRSEFGLLVKREDLSCKAPGPAFSKARGVYEHIKARPEDTIGVLDTYHSQAGHAVARACDILGKTCVNFYPEYKAEPGPREPQERAAKLGAQLWGLPAGRSAILYHHAKKELLGTYPGAYLMPNALKLPETVTETAREVGYLAAGQWPSAVILPSSSGTIAAGVIAGFVERRIFDFTELPQFIIHLGYSRSHNEVMEYVCGQVSRYIIAKVDLTSSHAEEWTPMIKLIDEGYQYKDRARAGDTPPWPCNAYYDLKAFRWWQRERVNFGGNVLLWNVG